MINRKNSLVVILLIIVLLLGYFIFKNEDKSTIVFVDMDVLYEKFELSKQYNQKVESFHQSSQIVLDSIESEIRALVNFNSNPALINAKKEQYFAKRNEFEQSYQSQASLYSEKVMKQLNEYINEFSKEKGYSFVLSKQQKGQLLYADESNDVTTEVLNFCNNRYKGIR